MMAIIQLMAHAPLVSARALTFLLIAGMIGVFAVRPFILERQVELRASSVTDGARPEDAIGSFRVRDLGGRIVPIVTENEPSIVMISSTTCGWCKRALRDIGEMAGGRPVPHLKVLTLEGAQLGVPMLTKENIVGAQFIGPAGNSDQVLLTFRYPGTPTFVVIDRNGRVARTMPGYPIREEMQHWLAVMLGDADVP